MSGQTTGTETSGVGLDSVAPDPSSDPAQLPPPDDVVPPSPDSPGPTGTDAPPSEPPAGAAPKTDWRDARIARLTAQRREAEARAQQAEAALTAARAGAPAPALDETEFNRRVEAEAERRAQLKAFNDSCNAVHQAGVKTYEDFEPAIARLAGLVDREDPRSIAAYNQFLQAAIDTEKGEHILYALGNDLNEASRLLGLSGPKLGVELAKLAYSAPGGLQVTSAPKPIRPVASRGAAHEAIRPSDPDRADALAMETWMARRQAEVAAQRSRPN